MNTKQCRKCNATKALSEFSKHKTRDGYRHECKPCFAAIARARRIANPDRANEIGRANYWKHREWYAAYSAAYRERRKDYLRAKKREYHEQNRERIIAKVKAWYEQNRSRVYETVRRSGVRRRASLALSKHHTAEEWQALLAAYGGRCAHCGTTECIARDHIVPLSKGGSDLIDNIQPLCRSCNSRKSTRLPDACRVAAPV